MIVAPCCLRSNVLKTIVSHCFLGILYRYLVISDVYGSRKESKFRLCNYTSQKQNTIFFLAWLIKLCFHYWVLRSVFQPYSSVLDMSMHIENSNAFGTAWYVVLGCIIVWSCNYYITDTDLLMGKCRRFVTGILFASGHFTGSKAILRVISSGSSRLVRAKWNRNAKTWSHMLGYMTWIFTYRCTHYCSSATDLFHKTQILYDTFYFA